MVKKLDWIKLVTCLPIWSGTNPLIYIIPTPINIFNYYLIIIIISYIRKNNNYKTVHK